MGNLKPLEIVLIIAVVLLLFGAKKLPDMARSLGKSARILKSEAKAMKKDDSSDPDGRGRRGPGGPAARRRAHHSGLPRRCDELPPRE